MSKIKLYDLIKQLLTDYPELRDSDKRLIWKFWAMLGFTEDDKISHGAFLIAPSPETIRRTRQKIQEKHKGLRSSQPVQELKYEKESEKGTFIYREPVQEGLC